MGLAAPQIIAAIREPMGSSARILPRSGRPASWSASNRYPRRSALGAPIDPKDR